MKNIHVLPTDKPSRIAITDTDVLGMYKVEQIAKYGVNQNIYITSEEEIQVNDYITDGYLIWKWKDDSSLLGRKKVILTTDQDLIKEGVQTIDDEFLEWFVKNPSCEEVEVNWIIKAYSTYKEYNIFIPKEEPKQETLEEAGAIAAGLCEHLEAKEQSMFIAGFQECLKWQQERSYSEEEVLELLKKSHFVEQNIEEWFEQFKK